jgi:thymidylate synthase (FAD)
VIARPVLDLAAVETFLSEEDTDWRRTEGAQPPEELVEIAGRLCYMSFGERQSPKENDTYIGHLVEQGHHSVLEHATWTFILSGVTRAFTHQFVRHRIGFSYSQLSQQYHDERASKAIMPELVSRHPELALKWSEAVGVAQRAYQELADELDARTSGLSRRERRRLLRSAARTVLPAATETKIAFTANARSLRHFLEERGSLSGDDEMRRVSVLLLKTMQREAPALFSDLKFAEGPAGPEVIARS